MKQWDSVSQNPHLFLWKGKFKMKKLIASMLCILIALTSMSFAVVAETLTVKNDRAINIYVDKTEVYAVGSKKSNVTVTVKIEKNDAALELANAKYTMKYDPTLFTTDSDPAQTGTISEMFYKEGGETYANGDVLATYVFTPIPQVEKETGEFNMVEAFTYTYMESIDHEKFEASTEGKQVTILLETYEITKKIDGNPVDETAGDVKKASFPYDDKPHSFEIETVPTATVEYTVKDSEGNVIGTYTDQEVVIKAEGEYVIEYVVTDKDDGYAPVEGTFTITIEKPVYYIEVVENYVIGKNLVLVYTDIDNVGFSYKGNPMVDVSISAYTYNDTKTTDIDEAVDTKYVYGFVPETIDYGYQDDFKAYKDLVSHWYGNEYEMDSVGAYDTDFNYYEGTDVQDITVGYGVMNGYNGYFANPKYQRNILKADLTQDKKVRGEDVGLVVDEAKK